MKNSIFVLAIATLGLMLASFAAPVTTTTAPLSPPSWSRLGAKKVNYQLDRDVIRVGFRDGRFAKLKVQVTGGDLNMRKMVVEYANGEKENIELRHKFSRRSGSRIIDLSGRKRVRGLEKNKLRKMARLFFLLARREKG